VPSSRPSAQRPVVQVAAARTLGHRAVARATTVSVYEAVDLLIACVHAGSPRGQGANSLRRTWPRG
jgi:hypothetical protein